MNQTILVVDDEPDIRDTLAELLELSGYVTVTAESVCAAYTMLGVAKIDLVVCDVVMPDQDGTMLLKRMRGNALYSSIPFIFISAYTASLIKVTGPLLMKPFGIDEMLDTIRQQLPLSPQLCG